MNAKRKNRNSRKPHFQNKIVSQETQVQVTQIEELFPSPQKIEYYEKISPGISDKIISSIMKLNENSHEREMAAISVEKKRIEDNAITNQLRYKQSLMSFSESVVTKIIIVAILITILVLTALVLMKDVNNLKIWLTFVAEVITILSLYFRNIGTR